MEEDLVRLEGAQAELGGGLGKLHEMAKRTSLSVKVKALPTYS